MIKYLKNLKLFILEFWTESYIITYVIIILENGPNIKFIFRTYLTKLSEYCSLSASFCKQSSTPSV